MFKIFVELKILWQLFKLSEPMIFSIKNIRILLERFFCASITRISLTCNVVPVFSKTCHCTTRGFMFHKTFVCKTKDRVLRKICVFQYWRDGNCYLWTSFQFASCDNAVALWVNVDTSNWNTSVEKLQRAFLNCETKAFCDKSSKADDLMISINVLRVFSSYIQYIITVSINITMWIDDASICE